MIRSKRNFHYYIIHFFAKLRKCVYEIVGKTLNFNMGNHMGVIEAVVLRFQELYRLHGIRLNELATRSGVTPSTVYSMVNSPRMTSPW